METASRDFTHPVLDEEVRALSGFYMPIKEVRLPYGDRQVLYVLGHGEVDNSCCTEGGCGYISVTGYVLDWKSRTDNNGRAVSRVEPITDRGTRKDLRRRIANEEGAQVSMIQFE